jgi:hypothetical protein
MDIKWKVEKIMLNNNNILHEICTTPKNGAQMQHYKDIWLAFIIKHGTLIQVQWKLISKWEGCSTSYMCFGLGTSLPSITVCQYVCSQQGAACFLVQ